MASDGAARPHEAALADGLGAEWTEGAAREVEAFHYVAAERTFDCRIEALDGGRLVTTPGIRDPEWNHCSGLAWSEIEPVDRLSQAREALAARGRDGVVVVAPWSKPSDARRALAEAGWRPCFRHLWSFFDLARPVSVDPVAGYEYVHLETADEVEQYVEVFVGVYDEDGRLDAGYAPALRRSATQPGMRHHLIRHRGEPVAIGTVIVEGGLAQIFNMVVRDGHRRQGLAEWLLNARLLQAREEGARRLTALSDNARIDRWLERRGFVPGWYSVGYAEGGAP